MITTTKVLMVPARRNECLVELLLYSEKLESGELVISRSMTKLAGILHSTNMGDSAYGNPSAFSSLFEGQITS